jgi:hypothetical protein
MTPEDYLPPHLHPMPKEKVHALCARITEAVDTSDVVMTFGMTLEIGAFRETCTPHDGRRVANALRHCLNRDDLADEVEALIPKP